MMNSKNIYLVRHGKVDGPPSLYGRTDISVTRSENDHVSTSIIDSTNLNLNGLHKPLFMSSPKKRCLSLVESMNNQLLANNKCVVIDDLKEMDFGCVDGLPFDQIAEDSKEWKAIEQFYESPYEQVLSGAETLDAFYQRIERAWSEILDKAENAEVDDVIVVAHGGVIRIIIAMILNIDWRQATLYQKLKIDYGSLTKIQVVLFDANSNENPSMNSSKLKSCSVEYIGKPVI